MSVHFDRGYAYQEVLVGGGEQVPAILIHGAGSSHLGWPAAIRHLPGKRILAIDLPNHGRSAQKELCSIEEYAEDIHFFLQGLGIQRANLVGHSMGAALVLQLMIQHPAICGRGALFAYAPQPIFNELYSKTGLPAEKQPVWMQAFTSKLFSPNFSVVQREKLSEPLFLGDKETLKNDLLLTHRYQPAFPVEKISTPLLLLFGADDPFINRSQKQLLIDHFTDSMVKEIPDAGHLFIWEHPELVQNFLLEFLA